MATLISLPVASFLAFAGWLWTPAVAGGESHPGEGTVLWALSAVVLVGGVVLAPGPARWRRLIGGLVVGVAWFLIGRFMLSAA